MRIARIVSGITTLGPGCRLVIWTNGCSRNCPGCVSQRLQSIDEFTEMDIRSALEGFALHSFDGVTISGGEPFEQISELCSLMIYLREQGVSDILIYTGYTLEELRNRKSLAIDKILEQCSVLIDGPYVLDQDTGKGNLKGSDNQRIHFLDPMLQEKYQAYMTDQRSMQEMDMWNVRLGVGIPSQAYIARFQNDEQKGI